MLGYLINDKNNSIITGSKYSVIYNEQGFIVYSKFNPSLLSNVKDRLENYDVYYVETIDEKIIDIRKKKFNSKEIKIIHNINLQEYIDSAIHDWSYDRLKQLLSIYKLNIDTIIRHKTLWKTTTKKNTIALWEHVKKTQNVTNAIFKMKSDEY